MFVIDNLACRVRKLSFSFLFIIWRWLVGCC